MFEEDPDWQNPVMNFIGEYQLRQGARARRVLRRRLAQITIEWGSSAWELARWVIVGRLDPDTLTIAYSDCTKSIVTYDDKGEIQREETAYEDGTGTVVFRLRRPVLYLA